MWDNAEVVVLLDEAGIIRSVSRNEEEALIHDVIGRHALDRIHEDYLPSAQEALAQALQGKKCELLLAVYADDGYVFWSRVQSLPSHLQDLPILLHLRRLPKGWGRMSTREQQVVQALHSADMNPKKAARILGISDNTLNAHRRSISHKCELDGIGDFWVFVERCR